MTSKRKQQLSLAKLNVAFKKSDKNVQFFFAPDGICLQALEAPVKAKNQDRSLSVVHQRAYAEVSIGHHHVATTNPPNPSQGRVSKQVGLNTSHSLFPQHKNRRSGFSQYEGGRALVYPPENLVLLYLEGRGQERRA